MKKRLSVISALLLFIGSQAFPQIPDNETRLRDVVGRLGQATIFMQMPAAKEMDLISRELSISSLKDKKLEIVISPLTIDWFLSRKYSLSIQDEDDYKGVAMASSVTEAMAWDKYPKYTQYDSIMQSFAALYPSLCDVDTIGTSIYGKQVFVLKISDNVNVDEDEPEVFYTSTIHGDETGGFILMLRLADYLLKNYPSTGEVKELVDNLEIWINPNANPDGSYRTGDIISSPTRSNANGYDLNRNFPDPDDDITNKQKETLDMIRFMRKHNFVISANFHAGEEVVNFPWDRWSKRHPDDDWFYSISRKYADMVHLHAIPGYMTFLENGVTNGYDWYYIYGGRQDFVTLELQGREVTIELDDTKLTPASALNALWEYNYRSLLGYLGNALYGIHGKVTDFSSGTPVPAKIFIEGHDADSSHIYTDSVTGSFTRLIAPGTWTLTFSATGYISKSVSVTVVNDVTTWVDVEMVPLVNPVDTIPVSGLLLYPNPVSGKLRIVLPDRQLGTIDLEIVNTLGKPLLTLYSLTAFDNIPLEIDLQELPTGIYTLIIRNRSGGSVDKTNFVVVHNK